MLLSTDALRCRKGHPLKLSMSTANRLRLVADQIVRDPDRWSQDEYDSAGRTITQVAGEANRQNDCNTAHCVAGWAVALSPPSEVIPDPGDDNAWDAVGTRQLGLAHDLARYVFYSFSPAAEAMAAFLNAVADLHPRQRNVAHVVANDRLNDLAHQALSGWGR